jgi:hypothetical protein
MLTSADVCCMLTYAEADKEKTRQTVGAARLIATSNTSPGRPKTLAHSGLTISAGRPLYTLARNIEYTDMCVCGCTCVCGCDAREEY